MLTLRIATRQSPLALWQAEHTAQRLCRLHADLKIELVKLRTRGDKILDAPLNKVGGKALFVKELEQALLNYEADIAVHSMKDVPMELPAGLQLPVILQREDPHDAFVSNRFAEPAVMPAGARIGTSSLRRQAQLNARYPHLDVQPLRGNVGSRLQKLDNGQFDAVILAVAGLKRLQLQQRIRLILDSSDSLPAVGQGAIGIECRLGDTTIEQLIQPLHDKSTADCIIAERAFNRRLNGGCQVPIAGFAVLNENRLLLRGLVAHPDGSEVIRGEISGDRQQAALLGYQLADDFLRRGAGRILTHAGIEI